MARFITSSIGALISLTMATSAVAIGPPFPDAVLGSEREIVSALSAGRPSSLKAKWETSATASENGLVIGRGLNAVLALQRYESGVAIKIENISYGYDSLMIVATIKSRTIAPDRGVTECCVWATALKFDLNGQGQIKAFSILEQRDGSWQLPPASNAKAE